MWDTFSKDELKALCKVGGLLDDEWVDGKEHDPNNYWGGPSTSTVAAPTSELRPPATSVIGSGLVQPIQPSVAAGGVGGQVQQGCNSQQQQQQQQQQQLKVQSQTGKNQPDKNKPRAQRSDPSSQHASSNRPLLRSADVPLPSARDQCNESGPIPAPAGMEPVPRMSHLNIQSVVPEAVLGRLQIEVSQMLQDILVVNPQGMALQAPMGNFPQPPVFYNTKLSRQHSRPGVHALLEPQGDHRLCHACWDGLRERGAQCSNGGSSCSGCDYCLGRMFSCPSCGVNFELRVAYESGSGMSSIGRAPDQFEVHTFTSAMEVAAQHLEQEHGLARRLQSCVLVAYLGSDFCASCALKLPHGSKRCGSTLHWHRDRGGGGNSQESTPNITLSVGAARTLSMELRLPPRHSPRGGGSSYTLGVGPDMEAQFELLHGSEFVLEPQDEEQLPRSLGGGDTAIGSFFHAMESEVAAGAVSCGLVFRDVWASAEVDVRTDRVIMSPQQRNQLQAHLHKGYNNQPVWAKGFRGSHAEALELARGWWSSRAAEYSAFMRPRLAAALAAWPSVALAHPQVAVSVGPAQHYGCM